MLQKKLMGQKAPGDYFFPPKTQRRGHLQLKNVAQLLFLFVRGSGPYFAGQNPM